MAKALTHLCKWQEVLAPSHLIYSVLSLHSPLNARTEVKSQAQVPQTSEGGQDVETASSKGRRRQA